MKEYIVFCEECREEVDYYTKKIKNYQIIKDKKYEYGANISYCKNCDSNVYVPHLEDENLKNLYDDFREKNNIISLEKVRDIPKKYNIGKLPLATLLGWGLQTFKRYYDGDVPSKQYSEILEKIYNDPSYFLSLLENKKDNLKSEKAYKKSKEATKKLLCNSTNSKLFEIEKYILSKKVRITPLSLQKLLYYIQGFSYAFLNKYLFLENCEAWVRGPVYRKIYDKYNKKYYCLDEIKNSKESNDFLITEEEKV